MTNGSYLNVANSGTMMALCAATIGVVVMQGLLFLRKGIKRSEELGIPKSKIKKVISSTAIFSIIPSLPIMVFLMLMMPTLGKFFPWLRVSVIGSGSYEYMAADMAATSMGFTGMADPNVNVAAFCCAMWVMTIGLMSGPITNVFLLKKYDGKIKEMSRKKNSFGPFFVSTLFIALVCVLAMPKYMDFAKPLGVFAAIVSSVTIVVCNKMASRYKNTTLRDFAFPLSMIVGMVSVILVSNIV